jgi:hypothetical protein
MKVDDEDVWRIFSGLDIIESVQTPIELFEIKDNLQREFYAQMATSAVTQQ